MTPEISVIIPFRNARPQLPVLLKALSRQTCARDAFEVIWIDDGSGDGGGGWLQEHLPPGWHLVVHTEPRGSYAARNSGLRAAEGENLAFTDVDCRPQEDWIEKGLAWLSSVPRVAGRVHLELSDSPSAAELVDAGRFLRQRRYVQEGFGATANLFVQRRVFDSLGGFDEHLKSGGDYEFGLRCSLAGIPIQYADDVVVSHPARASLRELLSKSERVGFGTGQLIRRGGMSTGRLAARVSDRFALARRRGVTERRVPVVGRKRTLLVQCMHLLVLSATVAGGLRGFLFPGPTAFADPRNRVKKGLA
jgi:glycosyltransferase involved in cell wall biosynthesis